MSEICPVSPGAKRLGLGVSEQNIFYFGALMNCVTPPGSVRMPIGSVLDQLSLRHPQGMRMEANGAQRRGGLQVWGGGRCNSLNDEK